ncbi:glucose dehydrogenase [Pseudoroseicyclus sp. CLL3-39]|uniref:Glucose dehydrogenase n=1 Tax=Pseudoroseicyclus tamaricis TaxID=2705421 RepID=A0A6B2JQC9_9RHOB|nr:glucose dehydrogenase [Pseudoroseicyclus tamaricis]
MALLILGWITIIFGIVLLAGGVWLIALGGSWYYAIAGLGLLATGVLLNMQNMAALWLYLVIWLGTLVWAWWEVGDEWWAQVPRMVAPTVLLIFILFAIPVLRRRRGHAE